MDAPDGAIAGPQDDSEANSRDGGDIDDDMRAYLGTGKAGDADSSVIHVCKKQVSAREVSKGIALCGPSLDPLPKDWSESSTVDRISPQVLKSAQCLVGTPCDLLRCVGGLLQTDAVRRSRLGNTLQQTDEMVNASNRRRGCHHY